MSPTIRLILPHFHRLGADMGFGGSFLKSFKKLKRKLVGGSRKPGRGITGTTGGRGDLAASVPQKVPHVDVEVVCSREGEQADVERSQRDLDPVIEAEVVVESGSGQEANNIDGDRTGRVDPPGPPTRAGGLKL